MPYEVLARKYRPKNFSELLGQDSVCQTLTNAIKQNRIYPVLLFTGSRGTGKTSTARILAKTLTCKNQKNLIPCDTCEDCLLIQDSRHLDVIEIDGASNNGVNAVRELRDTVNYMPSSSDWKIYIIDEAHMLSNSAFNALLKTFEEPPAHVLFVMATTEARKIPQTVLSRTQRLDFHLLSPSLVKKQLENICKKEELSISEEILWLIARQARGSLRDGQSLLDQVITFCGKDLSHEKVIQLLGLSDPHILFQCLQALLRGKEGEMIKVIESLRTKSVEPRSFLQNLVEALSQLLFLKKNPDNQPELVHASQQEIERMKKEIESTPYEDLHFLFDMLLKGEREMAFCHDAQLALEVLLLRFCSAPRLESLVPLNPWSGKEKSLSTEKKTEKTLSPLPDKPADFSEKRKAGVLAFSRPLMESKSDIPSPAKKEILTESKPENSAEVKKESLTEARPESSAPAVREAPLHSRPESKAEGLKEPKALQSPQLSDFEKRFDFLNFLRKKDMTLTALLENLNLKQESSKLFCFIVPDQFSYLKNKISEPSIHNLLEKYLTEFLDSKDMVKIKFLYNSAKAPSLREEEKSREQDQLLLQARKNPFVRELKDLFGGDIKAVTKNHK